MLLALAGPSGSGKTTVSMELCASQGYRYFAPHTTRPARPGERAQVGYEFVTSAEFQNLVDADSLLFHDMLYGHHYGLSKKLIEACSAEPKVLVTVPIWRMIDLQELIPETFCAYLLPPDETEQRTRISTRSSVTALELAERVINEDLRWFTKVPGLHLVPPAPKAEVVRSIVIAAEGGCGDGSRA
ncbi:hypothetical protein [Streptomyces scabiei]|uniref:hypothetical protein n=1 Tax=Streptomyces scabiei TaxID=1930 RepID=UPI0022772C61|nr:hypothetical protein [Streptomyces scabiei]